MVALKMLEMEPEDVQTRHRVGVLDMASLK